MWIFDLIAPKKSNLTCEQIIVKAMQENPWKAWDNRDFQKSPHFVGYKSQNYISRLRKKGLLKNGPKIGVFQTYTLTDLGLKQIIPY